MAIEIEILSSSSSFVSIETNSGISINLASSESNYPLVISTEDYSTVVAGSNFHPGDYLFRRETGNFVATDDADLRYYSIANPSGFINTVSGAAPLTNILAIPLSINTFGGISNLLGDPNIWADIFISGSQYKIPLYI